METDDGEQEDGADTAGSTDKVSLGPVTNGTGGLDDAGAAEGNR